MPQPRTLLYHGYLIGPGDDPREDSSWIRQDTMLDMGSVKEAMQYARDQIAAMQKKEGEPGKINNSWPNCIIFQSGFDGTVHCWLCTTK